MEYSNIKSYDLYRDLLKKYKYLSSDSIDEIIEKSIQCAQKIYKEIDKDAPILEHFEKYKVKIFEIDNDKINMLSFYDKGSNELVVVNNKLRKYLEDYNVASSSEITEDRLRQIVLAHEFYHVYEMNEKNIYTYSNIYKRKFLGFTWKDKIPEASEIGANEFSKLYNNLDFNPIIMNKIIECSYSKKE